VEISLPVTLAVLGAALLHAAWNALVKASADKRLDTVAVSGESEDIFPDVAKDRPRRLIRWEYIRAAEIFEDKVQTERVTGYHSRAA